MAKEIKYVRRKQCDYSRILKVQIVKELADPLPVIKMDENYLKEAFVNLIINAYQAIEKGGEIKIKTEKLKLNKTLKQFAYNGRLGSHDDHPEIILKSGTEVVRVSIRDTGRGIKKENLHRIFDPFFTLRTGGTGLGLLMVKRTVNAHNGIIEVASTEGKGATFFIYLHV